MENAFSRTATMSTTNWADDVEEEEAEMQRVESMQGLGSPRGHPGSPIRRGPQGGHLEEVPSEGGYGRSPPPPLPYSEGPALPDRPPFKAYLGNIPYDLDEEVVTHFFRGLDIVDIIITRHHDTGKPKGCFVEFASQEHLAQALTADGEPMLRRPVRIQVAEPPRRERDGFGERRGGGFGRRGGYEERGGRFEERGGRFEERRGGGGGGFADRYDRDREWPARRGPPAGDLPTSPRERPKLVLQPRRSAAPEGEPAAAAASGSPLAEAAPEGPPKPKANPFGDAKPIDTQSKLAQFEERLKQRKKEEAEAKRREKEAREKEGAEQEAGEKDAAGAAPADAAKPTPPPPPPAAAKPHHAPVPPPPVAAAPAATAGADSQEQGKPRSGPRVVTVPARSVGGRGAAAGGRGEGGRGAGGRGRGSEHREHREHREQHAEGRGGRGGGRGGRGGRGEAHPGRHQGHHGPKEEKPAKPAKAEHKASGAVPDHLRARGYVLDQEEAPKTKIENPFDLLNLADE